MIFLLFVMFLIVFNLVILMVFVFLLELLEVILWNWMSLFFVIECSKLRGGVWRIEFGWNKLRVFLLNVFYWLKYWKYKGWF